MRIAGLALVAALWGSAAVADDEPISTAGAGAPPASTDTAGQIDRWIADSPAARPEPEAELAAAAADAPRKIHGEVGVAVGTGGYRSGYVVTHIPIGESGSATIALGKTDYGDRMRPVWIGPGPMMGPSPLGAPLQ